MYVTSPSVHSNIHYNIACSEYVEISTLSDIFSYRGLKFQRRLITAAPYIKPLSTKLYLSDLKTQLVPRSKHSLLRL